MPPTTAHFWEPLDARARERLRSLVADFKNGDPLAPVSVIVPSTYAALDLRHDLGRRGSANLHLLLLPRLTELLGAPLLAARGLRPLTPLLEAAAVRAVAAQAREPLNAVGEHPALHQTLHGTFGELRHASEDGLSGLEALGGLRAEVVRLYRLFRRRTDPHFYDREALAQAAARAVAEGGAAPALRDLGPVVFYLLSELSPGEAALVEALARRWSCAAILGLTGEEAADGPIRELSERLAPFLGAPLQKAKPQPSPVERLVITPDPQQEVRWALRRFLRAAEEGVPFHRMAILYRQPVPYATLLPEELSLAGVPLAGPGNVPLAETAAGRTLLGLVNLVGGDLPRNDLMAWLTGCPVAPPGAHTRPIQPSHWDAVSRRAGVVGELSQWRERLGRYAAEMERRAAQGLEQGEISPARAERLNEEAAGARDLLDFVLALAGRLDPPAEGRAWADFARWARDLLETYLDRRTAPSGGEDSPVAFTRESEDEARRRIEGTLDEMATLEEVEPHPSLEKFRLALEGALASPLGHLGQTGRGVFVAPLAAARGMSFDIVCVVGMVEGAMPPPHHEDPLLPDRERQQAGGAASGIPLRRDRNAGELYRYRAALAAGEQCILSFPRANPGAQRGQFPSRWFLEAASELHGQPVYTSNLWSLGLAPWLTVAASLEDGLRAVADQAPADLHDRDLHLLWRWRNSGKPVAAHHLGAGELLSRALALEQGRSGRQFTRWDGDVSSLKDRARRLRLLDRPVLSSTSLETWAACPFRYLLGHVLGVAVLEQPEDLWTISNLEKGSLVHGVLDGFIRQVQETGRLPAPGQDWGPQHRKLLDQLAREAFSGAEARGVTGKSLLWDLEQEAMCSDLDAFLEADTQLRADFGTTPHRVEVAFGLSRAANGHPALPPAERHVPEVGTLRFRGALDRVDLDPLKRVALVLDYKTGSDARYRALKQDPVDAGRRLQLPIYALALEGILGEDFTVYAAYWFISAGGKYTLHPPQPVKLAEVAERFDTAVGIIARGIAGGLFPPNPGPEERGGFANCAWCDFNSLCLSRRDVLWQRKQTDPRLQAYLQLQNGKAEPEDGPE